MPKAPLSLALGLRTSKIGHTQHQCYVLRTHRLWTTAHFVPLSTEQYRFGASVLLKFIYKWSQNTYELPYRRYLTTNDFHWSFYIAMATQIDIIEKSTNVSQAWPAANTS